MLDIVFVLGTGGFFAVMLAYVAACERLGRSPRAPGEEGTK